MHTQTGTPLRAALEVLPTHTPIAPAFSSRLPGLESVSPLGEQDVWLHEALLGPYSEDILEYLNLARRTGGPVLDLGSGAGRLAVPFAQHGFAVDAVDRDAASLARLRAWAARIGPRTHQLVGTTQAELERLRLDSTYQLALMAGAMVAAVSPAARPGLLHEVASHLDAGGTLALDYTAHEVGALSEHPDRTWRFQVPRFDGLTEWVVARQVFDLEAMTERITYRTERSGCAQPSSSVLTTFKWIVDQEDLCDELHAAGLHITECKQHRLDRRTLSVFVVCHAGK
ncbi:SAM-dependent methyltransferase [Streptomyces sp. V4I23]|uniref:class I SAM-dependent methyltransferase n=1 Tax=Streptomyces sp. V4I23 TaxID=3042282 RepID=UPI0027820D0A|nr:class I SAM-dependent methyltransferase [Streptomyces sp. V4I23]MDQ1007381.1 SAM-dependent methyltransferase [Streptomyces sp. V4I23]